MHTIVINHDVKQRCNKLKKSIKFPHPFAVLPVVLGQYAIEGVAQQSTLLKHHVAAETGSKFFNVRILIVCRRLLVLRMYQHW